MVAFSPVQYLPTLVYFEGIASETLTFLSGSMSRRLFLPGEMIFLEGEACPGLCILESGRIKIFKVNTVGVEHVMHILGDGNTFNDIAAIDGGVNPANAAALSEAMVWLLPHPALHAALERDKHLAFNVIRCLTTRVRGLVRQIEDLALYSVLVRLARFLVLQSENEALSGPGVTRAAIAAHLATTPQTISTLLRELESMGAIRFSRHEILIVDEGLLRGIAML